MPLSKVLSMISVTPLAYLASMWKGPWTFQRPFLGNSALPSISNRAGEFGAHAPVGDVHVVGAPAGDHAEAIGLDAEPAGPVT